ncbi:MAG TPA: glutaminase A [Polyangiaceae bacterium]|nr:glutaminase A [Polyangiaceae bacterium]
MSSARLDTEAGIAHVQEVLDAAVERARRNHAGAPADYIPELARVPLEQTSVAVVLNGGAKVTAGDAHDHQFTFQSSAKLLTLIGLLEERGPVEVFSVVGSEPSGDGFGSVARLETHGPIPANPLINAGAIALCGQLNGSVATRVAWLSRWAEKLYGAPIRVDEQVRQSERATAERNRSIAHFLKYGGVISGDVEETLDVYFALCSLSAGVLEAAHLPAILAHGGLRPGTGERVLSKSTVAIAVSIMATCGMYNESGNYLVATGMPAKSGVSGVIVAVVPGIAGVAVSSPRLNEKGGSVRGHVMLREMSRHLGWHFALAADRAH